MYLDAVLARSKQIANAQGRLANSPAEPDCYGALALCAASCLAKAMIELSADADLTRNFNSRLLREDKFTFLPYVFEKHGFKGEAAKWVVQQNDNTVEADRLSWFNSLERL
jgi:hypothetical protein